MSTETTTAAPARLRAVRDLPGPPGLPLLGSSLQIRTERLHQHLEAWTRRYGDVYRVRMGRREFVAIANPDWIGTVLRDRPGGFQRSSRLTETAGAFGFTGLFAANGEDWRRQRPMVLGGLDPSHIKTFFPTLVKVTQRFAGRWQRAAAQGAPIDLQSDLMRYTVDVTAGLAFGTDINTIESREQVIQEHLDQVFPALFKRLFSPLPYWKWFKLPGDRRTEAHLLALREAVDGFIAAARRRLEENPALREAPANLIEAMLVAREREGSGITDADVAGNVLTMLLAGEDTTANTLAWTIWLLQQNPPALRRATEEARALLPAGGVPQAPDALRALDYVEACAHESMRLRPVAPLMAQQAVRDTVVGDLMVPAGTLLLCLLRQPAQSEAHFPRATEYLPERWLEGAGPAALASSARRVNMPFGAGPRLCPGRYLALVEMKMVLAMLLANFDVLGVDTPDGGPVQERLTMTMWPVGLRLRLCERAAA